MWCREKQLHYADATTGCLVMCSQERVYVHNVITIQLKIDYEIFHCNEKYSCLSYVHTHTYPCNVIKWRKYLFDGQQDNNLLLLAVCIVLCVRSGQLKGRKQENQLHFGLRKVASFNLWYVMFILCFHLRGWDGGMMDTAEFRSYS